ncbi:MAG: hypothetical protein HFJ48_01730 [Clostridia bacterium]|nr:hypothetical protein [Clostridia bacterium]
MDKVTKSKLRFIDYQVKEVILKQNDKFINDKEEIDIDFDLKHMTNIKDNRMKIKLEIVIFDETEEKNYPFYMKTVLEGNFAIEGQDIEKFEINGISLLYPYVRAIISTYTANSNIPTLILPPINVIEYYNKRKELVK